MKKFLLPFLIALVLTGCAKPSGPSSPSGREIPIQMAEYKFTPNEVQVKPGEQITWVLENKGTMGHEFASDEGRLPKVDVAPSQTRRVAWTAPTQPGRYKFVCPVHKNLGMEMWVVVQP